jgi:predicted nuclease with TOPRIM domain
MTEEEKVNQLMEERFELLQTVGKLAGIAARAEQELLTLRSELATSRSASNFWASETQKYSTRVKELEQRVNELSSPLAELARASKE